MAVPTPNRTYYDVLHVSRDAPRAIIRGSYRTLMQKLKCHPDLGGDSENASLINKAYAVLNDPEKRAAYDAQLDILDHVSNGFSGEAQDAGAASTAGTGGIHTAACLFCATPHMHGAVVTADAVCDTCGSPLRAAQSTRIETQGQRAVERLEKHRDLNFYTQWPHDAGHAAETRDISLNGLSFVTSQELRHGQRIKIVSSVLEAVAVVTHCSHEKSFWKTRCVVGVSFMTLRFVNPIGGFVSDSV